MKPKKILAVIGLISMFAGFQSQATPLNLVPDVPDFGNFYLTVSYNAGSGIFQASGYTLGYADPSGVSSWESGYTGPFVPDYAAPSFDLTAHITSAGVLTSGTVTIRGSMDYTGETVETLLAGDLNTGSDGIAFGSLFFAPPNTGADRFEFTFKVTGGNSTIVSDFGGVTGAYNCGIILVPFFGPNDVLFDGSWTTSFSSENSQNGVADTVLLVPEPSSILLALVGGVLCVGAYRCRRNTLTV